MTFVQGSTLDHAGHCRRGCPSTMLDEFTATAQIHSARLHDHRLRVRSLRQFFASLLAHHVIGVPVRPVFVRLPGSRLVLPMRSGGTPKRAR